MYKASALPAVLRGPLDLPTHRRHFQGLGQGVCADVSAGLRDPSLGGGNTPPRGPEDRAGWRRVCWECRLGRPQTSGWSAQSTKEETEKPARPRASGTLSRAETPAPQLAPAPHAWGSPWRVGPGAESSDRDWGDTQGGLAGPGTLHRAPGLAYCCEAGPETGRALAGSPPIPVRLSREGRCSQGP